MDCEDDDAITAEGEYLFYFLLQSRVSFVKSEVNGNILLWISAINYVFTSIPVMHSAAPTVAFDFEIISD